MKKVDKAGCILINPKDRTVAMVYRDKQNDYSFPKGHMEEGENFIECAIRETAEETKRNVILMDDEPVYVDHYITPRGEDVNMYYYLAKDNGVSANESLDTHETHWVKYEDVLELLSYDSLRKVWISVKDKIESIK